MCYALCIYVKREIERERERARARERERKKERECVRVHKPEGAKNIHQ